jgi:hypothetical protein
MCYAIITAKFGQGEEPQTIRLETAEDFEAKLAVLRENDHCVSISVYKRVATHQRKSVWDTAGDVAQNTGD